MIVLMDEQKHLRITKSNPVFKFETGCDELKFLIPEKLDEIEMSYLNCVILVTLPKENPGDESKGLFKYLKYDDELYKNRLTTSVPITTAITKTSGNVEIWLLFIKPNPENPKLASNVIETYSCNFNIENNGSKYMSTEGSFDEIWEHSSVDKLQKDVEKLQEDVEDKADSIEVKDNNTLVLKSGDQIISEVELNNDVEWEEWS